MRRAKAKESDTGPADPGAVVAAAALSAALLASALLVDPGAEASFDAPKRLATLVLIGVAAAATFLWNGRHGSFGTLWRAAGPLPRAALVLTAVAVAGSLASALLSPRRALSLDAERSLLLFALLLPLGSSRLLGRYGRGLLGVFLGVAAVNAAVSLLQGRRILRPFLLELKGTRDATGAFVGNVGYLALGLAVAAVASLAVALVARRPVLRILCAAALPLYLSDLVLDQNLTSLTAFLAGAAALAGTRLGRRAILPAALILGATLVGLWIHHPARRRATAVLAAARSGDWDQVLTYRLGPWSAAVEMARERPALGFGPGTFAAEFVPHRLKAEIRAHRRFVNPLMTSSYGEAHSEPLQALAEGGLAGLAAIAAASALLLSLWHAARRSGASGDEAGLLFAVLVAGAVAALTWFPLQRPVSAIPLLLAAGRGWRLSAEASPEKKE